MFPCPVLPVWRSGWSFLELPVSGRGLSLGSPPPVFRQRFLLASPGFMTPTEKLTLVVMSSHHELDVWLMEPSDWLRERGESVYDLTESVNTNSDQARLD